MDSYIDYGYPEAPKPTKLVNAIWHVVYFHASSVIVSICKKYVTIVRIRVLWIYFDEYYTIGYIDYMSHWSNFDNNGRPRVDQHH